MEIPEKLTKEEIDAALKENELEDIGLVVTDKSWHLGNQMGNLRMPIGHLIQTCIDYLRANGKPIPQPKPEFQEAVEQDAAKTAKKATKHKEIAA